LESKSSGEKTEDPGFEELCFLEGAGDLKGCYSTIVGQIN